MCVEVMFAINIVYLVQMVYTRGCLHRTGSKVLNLRQDWAMCISTSRSNVLVFLLKSMNNELFLSCHISTVV